MMTLKLIFIGPEKEGIKGNAWFFAVRSCDDEVPFTETENARNAVFFLSLSFYLPCEVERNHKTMNLLLKMLSLRSL